MVGLDCPCCAARHAAEDAARNAQAVADGYLEGKTRLERELAQAKEESAALRWAMDWDTVVGIVQEALCDYGTSARRPDGTLVRDYYNGLAKQILDQLEPRWQAVIGENPSIVEHALQADDWKERYESEHKVLAPYREGYTRDRATLLHAGRALRLLWARYTEAVEALAARAKLSREWIQILDWLIEDTTERCASAGPDMAHFYAGKESALTYLRTLADADLDDTTEHDNDRSTR